MTGEQTQICEIHKTPMDKVETGYDQTTGEYEYDWLCRKCEEEWYIEQEQKQYREIYDSDPIDSLAKDDEKIKKIESSNPEIVGGEDFITKYSGTYVDMFNVSNKTAEAVMRTLISLALYNVKLKNSKSDKLRANISHLWIAPSGSGKSPILENIRTFIREGVFGEYERHDEFTGKGLLDSLKMRRGDPDFKKIFLGYDEFSTGIKQVYKKGGDDLFEELSKTFDNKLESYASVRGGHQRYPDDVHAVMWLSGVEEILSLMPESLWRQGFASRTYFLDIQQEVEWKPITGYTKRLDELREIHKDMAGRLKAMQEINLVDWSQIEGRYNEFCAENLRQINAVKDKSDIRSAPIQMKIKYPEHLFKLSMISAASRGNFTRKNDKGESLLILEIQDFNRSIRWLEEYHQNYEKALNMWISLHTKKLDFEDMSNYENRVIQVIHDRIMKGESFVMERDQEAAKYNKELRQDKNYDPRELKTEWIARKPKDGEKYKAIWIKRSDLRWYFKTRPAYFKDTIELMIDSEVLAERSAYDKDASRQRTGTYYALIEDAKKASEEKNKS